MTVRQFFGRKGLLSEWHPNYEFRAGQLEMAVAVAAALATKSISSSKPGPGRLSPTSSPRSLSARRAGISTGTKTWSESQDT